MPRGPRGRGGRRPRRAGRGIGRPKPLIQDIFKRGQEVLVQVIKEGIGTKGPTLSTYISIAGRYLVLMPGLNRIGVSRKITDEEQRRRLREMLQRAEAAARASASSSAPPASTATRRNCSATWPTCRGSGRSSSAASSKLKAPAEIYQESDMITRTIRDIFTSDIDTIWVDETDAFEHAQEFLQIVMPRYANRIKLYDGTEPMFHKYGIEERDRPHPAAARARCPTAARIVIDQTEALVAIDVNSGNFRADNNAEETAYQMNLQAAKEIARQLRLRDLGGVIVNDFIDMRDEKHRRGVETGHARRRQARPGPHQDPAASRQFGIIEMTRQRIRPSLKRSVYQDCPHCSAPAR